MDIAPLIAVNRRRLGLEAASTATDRAFSKKTDADTRLCVYGRMSPDGPEAHLLAPLGGTWCRGSFPGYLQNAGACIADGECPGLAWTPDGERNVGHLLTSSALPDHWAALDAHEGEGYSRLLTPVETAAGTVVANIYVSTDASRARLLILDGMNVHDDADFRP